MVVVELSESARKQMTAGMSPFRVAPQRLALTLTRDKGLQVVGRAILKDGAEAKTLAEGLDNLKKQALEAIKNPPPQAKIPPVALELARKILNDARVMVKDREVIAQLTIPAETPRSLRRLLEENLPKPRDKE